MQGDGGAAAAREPPQPQQNQQQSPSSSPSPSPFGSAGSSSAVSNRVVGEMLKQGHVRKSWKRRFFALDVGGKLCTYYMDKTMSKKKGDFSLEDASVEPLVSAPGRRENVDNSLRVRTKAGKDFLLECVTHEERDEWLRCFRACAGADGEAVDETLRRQVKRRRVPLAVVFLDRLYR
jgi:PH domain